MDGLDRCKKLFFGSEGAVIWLSNAVKRAKEKNLDTFLDLMQDAVWSSQTVVKYSTGKAKKMAGEVMKKAAAIKAKKDMNPRKVAALVEKAKIMAKIATKSCIKTG